VHLAVKNIPVHHCSSPVDKGIFMTINQYDAIVIGGGHNGLFAAA
jgi:hypothetical protein